MAEDPFTACAEQLARTPVLVHQLLDDHRSTPDGWCRAHDGHAERHPCSIRQLAELARSRVNAEVTGWPASRYPREHIAGVH